MVTIAQERNMLAAVGMRLRRREQWGARRAYTDARTVDEPANRVFVHITVTNPGNYPSFDAHVRAVENIGATRFPATGISYNRLFLAGTRDIYEGQPMGRRGAHTVNDFRRSTCSTSGCPSRGQTLTAPNRNWNLNYNARSYVYCSNVGFSVPDHVVDDMARAIAADKLAGLVTRSAPIHGHRCVSAKSCPGDRVWARMGEISKKVDHYLRVGLGGGTTPPPEDDLSYSKWTAAEKAALVKDVTDGLLNFQLGDQPLRTNLNWTNILVNRLYDRLYKAHPTLGEPVRDWHSLSYLRRTQHDTQVVRGELAASRSDQAVMLELLGTLLEHDSSNPLTKADLEDAVERGMKRVEVQVRVVDDAEPPTGDEAAGPPPPEE